MTSRKDDTVTPLDTHGIYEDFAAFSDDLAPFVPTLPKRTIRRPFKRTAWPSDVPAPPTPTGKTSEEAPLRLDEVPLSTPGKLFVTFAPGKKQAGRWNRDTGVDVRRMVSEYNISLCVTLIEDFEFKMLGIEDLASTLASHGIPMLRLSIRDGGTTNLPAMSVTVGLIGAMLSEGANVVVHCKGGMGRAGTVAACTAIMADHLSATEAIALVREHRPAQGPWKAIENKGQELFVASFAALQQKGVS